MISITATRLHWIKDDGEDDPSDLCAHSPVRLLIDDQILIAPEDGDYTVSAAAIYLLRTLQRDHTKDSPVGSQLFPCCGHGIFDLGQDDVVIVGCPNGADLYVCHEVDRTIRLQAIDGKEYVLPLDLWRRSVIEFADAVQAFYERTKPKNIQSQDDKAGYAKMMAEWKIRRENAEAE